jgi:predicted permease
MNGLVHDFRLALRKIRRNPGFAVVTIITIAIGVGGTVAVFSVANALLLRPPAGVEEPRRVVDLWGATESESGFIHSYPTFQRFRESARSTENIAAYGVQHFSLSTGGQAERIHGIAASDNYFEVLGTAVAAGRLFQEGDEQVVVLSHALWTRRFGADRQIIGETVRINGHPVTVVGVAERGFRGTLPMLGAEAWLPITLLPSLPGGIRDLSSGSTWLQMVARLRLGVGRDQASEELSVLARRMSGEEGHSSRITAMEVLPVGQLPSARTAVLGVNAIFLILALLVLAIAGSNVTGMFLARSASLSREMSVRLALGARRGRLVRQLLVENIILLIAGGLAGAAVAVWVVRGLAAIDLPIDLPLRLDLTPDWRVFSFTLLVIILAGIAFGLGPAIRGSDLSAGAVLRANPSGDGRRTSRFRDAQLVGQVAISVLLLVTAGLFVRGLHSARTVDPGFDPSGVLAVELDLEIQGYGKEEATAFFERLLESTGQLPGVRNAAHTWLVPLGGVSTNSRVRVNGEAVPGGVPYNAVGANFFSTLRIPLLAGREFVHADREGAPPVAIVNRAFAERHFPESGALGRHIEWDGRAHEVVGVVEHVRHASLSEQEQPFLFVPIEQRERNLARTLLLRTQGDPAALVPLVRSEIEALDPYVPMLNAAPLNRIVSVATLPYRMAVWFSGGLGILGLVLACVGLYSLLAYSVARRTHEIGVRLAVGAQPGRVARMVIVRGGVLGLLGLAIGMMVSFGVTRFLSGLLFGVSPTDGFTLVTVALLILVTALLSAGIPALRASRVDPIVAFKAE